MTTSLSSEALVQSWHQLSAQETIERLNSDPKTGLRKEVAEQRQEEFGPNHLTPAYP
jgi:magnesium-transporting ATPase (P-type)